VLESPTRYAVSLAPANSAEVRRRGLIGGSPDAADKLVRKLAAPDVQLRVVHDAGPGGFVPCRQLRTPK
jgi:hypothetical protein